MTILLRNQTLKLLTARTAVQTPSYYCTMPWKHIRHPGCSCPLFYTSIRMAGGWSWESRHSPETLTAHVRLIASNHGENHPDGCSWMCHQSVICVLPPCHQKQSSRHKGIMTHRWGANSESSICWTLQRQSTTYQNRLWAYDPKTLMAVIMQPQLPGSTSNIPAHSWYQVHLWHSQSWWLRGKHFHIYAQTRNVVLICSETARSRVRIGSNSLP